MPVYIVYIYLFISVAVRELWGCPARRQRPRKHYRKLLRITTDYIVIIIIAIMFIMKRHHTQLLGESLCVLMLLTFLITTTAAAKTGKRKYVAEGGKFIPYKPHLQKDQSYQILRGSRCYSQWYIHLTPNLRVVGSNPSRALTSFGKTF